MWINKRAPKTDFVRFKQHEDRPVQRQFQAKYITLISFFVVLVIGAMMAPIVYFFNENYTIFVNLAYEHSPQLVQYLEQEKQWLNSYIITAGISALAFCVVFSSHITARMIGPIMVLRAHIKTLIRGNWSVREVNIRDKDEFRDLISSYNYFYYCLRQLTQEDIVKLEGLAVDPQNRAAYAAWKKLIDSKSEQLGLPQNNVTEISAKPSTSRGSRHAS